MIHLTDHAGTYLHEGDGYLRVPVSKDDVAAYLAFITARYPLLREALDRVADELVEEGVDLQRLCGNDPSVLDEHLPDSASGT
ncbi:hypothetical protein AB0N64_12235 [Microbacterium sp. NPDC089318]